VSGWVFDTRQKPRPDPVPAKYLARAAERRAMVDVRVPVTIGWALDGDVYWTHDDDGTTRGGRLVYHVSRTGIVTVRSTPVEGSAPAGLVWHCPDASATADTAMLPGVPVIRE
jgi:hypothetical protein